MLAVCLMTAALVLSALIPREAMEENIRRSAEWMSEADEYMPVLEHVETSRVDHYADAMLLNIARYFDGQDPLRSVMKAEYYADDSLDRPHSLLAAVEGDLPANRSYLRYWHGSLVFVQALLTVLTIDQIYLWHAVLLSGLVVWLFVRLIRKRMVVPAVGLGAGLIGVTCWFVPLSMEYTWVFLILLGQMHLMLGKNFPADWKGRGLFFLLSGMITNYLDFLTCETLTLLTPMLMLLWLDRKEGMPSVKELLKAAALWAVGYGWMYLAKWGLAALVLGENVAPYVTAHVEQRLIGAVGEMNFFQEAFRALARNVEYLFPMGYGIVGMMIGIAIPIAAAYVGYVRHRKGFDRKRVWVCAVIGLIPYVRYAVLMNHSFLHAFFTCRAQLTTIFAGALIVAELTGWGEKRGKI